MRRVPSRSSARTRGPRRRKRSRGHLTRLLLYDGLDCPYCKPNRPAATTLAKVKLDAGAQRGRKTARGPRSGRPPTSPRIVETHLQLKAARLGSRAPRSRSRPAPRTRRRSAGSSLRPSRGLPAAFPRPVRRLAGPLRESQALSSRTAQRSRRPPPRIAGASLRRAQRALPQPTRRTLANRKRHHDPPGALP